MDMAVWRSFSRWLRIIAMPLGWTAFITSTTVAYRQNALIELCISFQPIDVYAWGRFTNNQ